jgi:hypothetical protein
MAVAAKSPALLKPCSGSESSGKDSEKDSEKDSGSDYSDAANKIA